jgi:hypothetical protein
MYRCEAATAAFLSAAEAEFRLWVALVRSHIPDDGERGLVVSSNFAEEKEATTSAAATPDPTLTEKVVARSAGDSVAWRQRALWKHDRYNDRPRPPGNAQHTGTDIMDKGLSNVSSDIPNF